MSLEIDMSNFAYFLSQQMNMLVKYRQDLSFDSNAYKQTVKFSDECTAAISVRITV